MSVKDNTKILRSAWDKRQSCCESQSLPITNALLEILERPLPPAIRRFLRRKVLLDLKPGASYADAIALVLVVKALLGDASAVKEITDRIEGPADPRGDFVTQQPPTVHVDWGSSPIAEAAAPHKPSN